MYYKLILISIFCCLPTFAKDCTYSSYTWNTIEKKLNGPKRVKLKYNELSSKHRDKLGCTICEEDQVEITLVNLVSFKACHKIADDLTNALNKSILEGFDIHTVQGYLVKITRGEIDSMGNRTGFSNHSFGSAIDINRKHNGLYNNCINFSKECVLSQGGEWNPRNHLSITKRSEVYDNLRSIDMKWGGEIKGKQKDFMHFSRSGY